MARDEITSATVPITASGLNRLAAELVFGAVQEAESLLRLPGHEKKRPAYDIIGVPEDMNFIPRDGLVAALIESSFDLLIEVSVHFFNKRGAFDRRRVPAPSIRP